MTKAVAKKEPVGLSTEVLASWGQEDMPVEAQDILIPRIILMQGLSQFVQDGKAAAGDIVLSQTAAKLPKPLKFIPLKMTKTWLVQEERNGKFEYAYQEAVTPQNAAADWEFQDKNKDGKMSKFRRNLSFNFYVLLPDHIEREKHAIEAVAKGELPNPNDALLPCMISFRRTSMPAGKALATYFAKCASFKLPPAVGMLELASEKVKGDLGTYSVFTVTESGKTDPYHLMAAKRWYDTLAAAKNIKVDDSVDEDIDARADDSDAARFMA